MQSLPPPPASFAPEDDDFGLTPFTLSMHLLNLLLNKALIVNPQLRVQTVADASDGIVELELSEESQLGAVSSSTPNGQNPIGVIATLLRNDGLFSLSRGIFADFLFSVPCFANEAAATFLTTIALEMGEIAVLRFGGGDAAEEGSALAGFALLVASRALPALFNVFTATPRDTVLTQLQCDISRKRSAIASTSDGKKKTVEQSAASSSSSNQQHVHRFTGAYSDTWCCIKRLWRYGGGARAFYRGWWLDTARVACESTAYFGAFYAVAHSRAKDAGPLSPKGDWAMGIGAALIGAIVAQPFNVVRRRMFLSAATSIANDAADDDETGAGAAAAVNAAASPSYGSVSACVQHIIATKGYAGLWQGFGTSIFFVAVGSASNFLLGSDI